MKELRDYQKDVLNQIFKCQGRNLLVGLPTGAGKTVIASELIKTSKFPVLFLVPRLDLLQQSIDCFTEQGLKVGVIWKDTDQHSIPDLDVYVSVRQTMYRKPYFESWVKDKVIILDEAHIGLESQKTYYYKKCKRLIGLTATPEQMSKRSMLKTENLNGLEVVGDASYAIYDEYIYPYQIPDLQKLGYLSQYSFEKVKSIKIPEDVKKRWLAAGKVEGDFDYLSGVISENLNTFANYTKDTKGKTTLVFLPTIADAYKFLEQLGSDKWAIVTGETTPTERASLYAKLESGELEGLLNCGVLTTGFDLPKVKRLVLLRHILSKSLFVQIIGRALRPYKGEEASILDCLGSFENFKDCFNDSGIVWFPEGKKKVLGFEDFLKEDIKDRFGLSMAENYKKDPLKAFSQIYQNLIKSYDELDSYVRDMESNISIKPPVYEKKVEVEKVVFKTTNQRQTPQEVYSYLTRDFFAESKRITPSVLREFGYDKSKDSPDIRLSLMKTIWDRVISITWDEANKRLDEFKSCFRSFYKMLDWWFKNFEIKY